MYIEEPIETFKTSKGFKIDLQYSYHQYDIHDMLEAYVHFCFIDRDIKHINTLNYGEDELYIALGNDAKNLGYDTEDTQTLETEAKAINDKYWIYPIDIYEHSMYNFSIGYKHGRDNRFGGVLLIDKEKWKEYRTEEEPKNEDLNYIMKTFTALYNGWIYEINISQKDVYTNKSGRELIQREYIDGISGIIDDRKDEYKDYFEKEYGELIEE